MNIEKTVDTSIDMVLTPVERYETVYIVKMTQRDVEVLRVITNFIGGNSLTTARGVTDGWTRALNAAGVHIDDALKTVEMTSGNQGIFFA